MLCESIPYLCTFFQSENENSVAHELNSAGDKNGMYFSLQCLELITKSLKQMLLYGRGGMGFLFSRDIIQR